MQRRRRETGSETGSGRRVAGARADGPSGGPGRRQLLLAVLGSPLLAGCVGIDDDVGGLGGGDGQGDGGRNGTTEGVGDGASSRGAGFSASQEPADGSLVLPSLDVAGSPGGEVALRPRGAVALLDFFATWCAPCKPEMANLRAARERFDPEAVHIVSITQETDEAAIRSFWREYEGTWPVTMEPDLAATQRYDVTALPTIVVLAPDGTRVMRHVGLAGEDRIVEAIEEALDRGTATAEGEA